MNQTQYYLLNKYWVISMKHPLSHVVSKKLKWIFPTHSRNHPVYLLWPVYEKQQVEEERLQKIKKWNKYVWRPTFSRQHALYPEDTRVCVDLKNRNLQVTTGWKSTLHLPLSLDLIDAEKKIFRASKISYLNPLPHFYSKHSSGEVEVEKLVGFFISKFRDLGSIFILF